MTEPRSRASGEPRWWELRRAQNRKPATYRCPLCDEYLPPLKPHVLMSPEGDVRRRRHAHTECVMAARKAGKLPTREEWLKAKRAEQPPTVSLWRRAFSRLGGGRPEP